MKRDYSIYNFKDKIEAEYFNPKLLGSKGYNLCKISTLGVNVPEGFIISTKECKNYLQNNKLPDDFFDVVKENVRKIEQQTGKNFGDPKNPLLVSVRSGAEISMPGMMDTILNLGMNDQIARSIASGADMYFAYDCYIRFIEMFSEIVLGVNKNILGKAKEDFMLSSKKNFDELNQEELDELVFNLKKTVQNFSSKFPDDPYDQLYLAVESVMNSWNSQRAQIYRKLNNIDDNLGTAVIIQSMVFGNFDENSCTGVLFTRNPVDGEDYIYGEYITKAQGEDIVSGKRTPVPINSGKESLKEKMPEIYNVLESSCKTLEMHYKDMQDIEFTVESGKLYILQTRSGKRTAAASVKIAYDFYIEGIISKNEAILRIDVNEIDKLLHPRINKKLAPKPLSKGLAASPGAATGKIVFSSDAAEIHSKNFDVILLRTDTCPEDISGMSISKAIVTSRGGLTSHAAVVARGMGKPCVCGASDLQINHDKLEVKIGNITLNELDTITIDGSSGEIFLGVVDVINAEKSREFEEILTWADEIRDLSVRANAETEADFLTSLEFGADGIGLCRTEHMFFDKEKISLIRQMIVSNNYEDRAKILSKLLPYHENDFIVLFKNANSKPVNIRLLDPPLHEFLPSTPLELETLAKEMDIDLRFISHQIERLREVNPMLGHRGARLGVTHPDIYEMQVNAIISTAIKVQKSGIPVNCEIMLPLISNEKELLFLKKLVTEKANQIMVDLGEVIEYKLGTMIELPRAAIIADKISPHVDYFSFGTNDLTQTVYGISRDDISSFMPEYKSTGIFKYDPFQTIDKDGVGEIIKMAINKGKSSNKTLTSGVCGEHGGDPKSIEYFVSIGVNYVSCSPYRIPAARIAAAQSKLKNQS